MRVFVWLISMVMIMRIYSNQMSKITQPTFLFLSWFLVFKKVGPDWSWKVSEAMKTRYRLLSDQVLIAIMVPGLPMGMSGFKTKIRRICLIWFSVSLLRQFCWEIALNPKMWMKLWLRSNWTIHSRSDAWPRSL